MLNEIIEISSGFQSSVNIAFDLYNDKKIQSFIPTSSALELITNVISSTEADSTHRAKILTGAYGRGKSHIVLVLLSILNRKDKKDFYLVHQYPNQNRQHHQQFHLWLLHLLQQMLYYHLQYY